MTITLTKRLRPGIGRQPRSGWNPQGSTPKPAYRCWHGYTGATCPVPGRPKNLNVREDQILPRLAALAILRASDDQPGGATRQITASVQAAELIDHLRATGVTLIHDPASRALRTGTTDAVAVNVG